MNDASAPGRILIVDDDPIVATSIAGCLTQCGHEVSSAHGGEQALELILMTMQASEPMTPFAVMITDMAMPGIDGLELIKRAAAEAPTIVPIVISGYASIERAVAAVKRGAIDVLTKPLAQEEIQLAVSRALQQHVLRKENSSLRQTVERLSGVQGMVASDARMERILDVVESIARCSEFQLMGLTDQLASIDDGSPLPATLAESTTARSLEEMMKECERSILCSALGANDWNRQKTADALKINRATLYKKINSLGIQDRTSTG